MATLWSCAAAPLTPRASQASLAAPPGCSRAQLWQPRGRAGAGGAAARHSRAHRGAARRAHLQAAGGAGVQRWGLAAVRWCSMCCAGEHVLWQQMHTACVSDKVVLFMPRMRCAHDPRLQATSFCASPRWRRARPPAQTWLPGLVPPSFLPTTTRPSLLARAPLRLSCCSRCARAWPGQIALTPHGSCCMLARRLRQCAPCWWQQVGGQCARCDAQCLLSLPGAAAGRRRRSGQRRGHAFRHRARCARAQAGSACHRSRARWLQQRRRRGRQQGGGAARHRPAQAFHDRRWAARWAAARRAGCCACAHGRELCMHAGT